MIFNVVRSTTLYAPLPTDIIAPGSTCFLDTHPSIGLVSPRVFKSLPGATQLRLVRFQFGFSGFDGKPGRLETPAWKCRPSRGVDGRSRNSAARSSVCSGRRGTCAFACFQPACGHAVVDHREGVACRHAVTDVSLYPVQAAAGFRNHVHRPVRRDNARKLYGLLHVFPAAQPWPSPGPRAPYPTPGSATPPRVGVLLRPARKHDGEKREHGGRAAVCLYFILTPRFLRPDPRGRPSGSASSITADVRSNCVVISSILAFCRFSFASMASRFEARPISFSRETIR